jgi:hypothetical protein
MKKIPTLYVRDENDRSRVTQQVTPGCEWVLAGEGVPTRKLDGTCMMFDGTDWWARREVKPGKVKPENFMEVEFDEVTGKTVGWEPVEQSPFAKFWLEAMDGFLDRGAGTYELIGPKVNGNPEHHQHHALIRHGINLEITPAEPLVLIERLREAGWEGVVWHHPDGRMVKLKVRDYPQASA